MDSELQPEEGPHHQLAAIISTLGGPSIQPADIEWAVDLPSGKSLLTWIAAQLGSGAVKNDLDDGTRERLHRAALRNIALEANEVKMCVLILSCYFVI
jgi:hypothetical protein